VTHGPPSQPRTQLIPTTLSDAWGFTVEDNPAALPPWLLSNRSAPSGGEPTGGPGTAGIGHVRACRSANSVPSMFKRRFPRGPRRHVSHSIYLQVPDGGLEKTSVAAADARAGELEAPPVLTSLTASNRRGGSKPVSRAPLGFVSFSHRPRWPDATAAPHPAAAWDGPGNPIRPRPLHPRPHRAGDARAGRCRS